MTETKGARGGGPEGGILTEGRGHVFMIGLNRPEKYNGFSPAMLQQLGEAYSEYERNDAYRCAVLYAEGEHFTAGLDLSLLDVRARLFPEGEVDPLGLRPPFRRKPGVAAVHGVCLTLGIELALASDIVVAAADTRFAQMEVKRALLAFGGAPIRMVQSAGWGNAMRYLLTGDEFDAETARRLGFIQEIVPPGQARARAVEIAEAIAAQAPLAVQAMIEAARTGLWDGPAATVEKDAALVARMTASADFEEAVASFKERREPVYKGE